MLRISKLRAALCAAALAVGTAAAANTHEIIIYDRGFFPETVYLDVGDTLKFTNWSGKTQHVIGKNDKWHVKWIGNNKSKTIKIWNTQSMEFRRTTSSNKKYNKLNGQPRGFLSTSNPPLGF
ncbi:MAG: hypothetical protein AAF218_03825 [Pseudomonadota bacterium]